MEHSAADKRQLDALQEDWEPPSTPDCGTDPVLAELGSPAGLETAMGTGNFFADGGRKKAPRKSLIHPAHTRAQGQISPAADAFRREFFPQASESDWNNWKWQVQNRITKLADLDRIIRLSKEELDAIQDPSAALPVGVTPYYLSLVDRENPADPLRRCVIPTASEHVRGAGEADDPLGEDHDSAVPGLVHRYPDRVLLLATGFCSTYCRYCTRSRMVAGKRDDCRYDRQRLEKALGYIESHQEVRDVLVSGGDPLTLSDENLDWLLGRLRRIEHVEIIRIGTKVPVVLPQRITPALVKKLRRHHPLFISIHFTHPAELTPETVKACTMLADAGIPLGSQTVLLKGINDSVDTLKPLFQGLLKTRVRPYYLYQCDPITGSAHFRTTVAKGLEMIQGLRGHTTGYAVPTYVIDAPGGGGKIAMYPDAVVSCGNGELVLRNYEGGLYSYPDSESCGDARIH